MLNMLIQSSKIIAIITEPLYLLILAILISITLYINKQKSKALLLTSTLIFTTLIIKTLKYLINSPRPTSMLIQETGNSFPSGHTTFAIVFFGLLVYILTKPSKRIVPIIIASLIIIVIALSRLILRAHYPIDIIAGLIIGTTILIISILIHKKQTI